MLHAFSSFLHFYLFLFSFPLGLWDWDGPTFPGEASYNDSSKVVRLKGRASSVYPYSLGPLPPFGVPFSTPPDYNPTCQLSFLVMLSFPTGL